jgi:predicted ATPase
VGETPQLFPVLWGLWYFYGGRQQMRTARDLGEQLLSLAQRAQDPALLLQAHHALGPTYIMTGDWVAGQAHLEQGIALYDPRQHRGHSFLYGGHDPGVCCHCNASWSLWVLGYPDPAWRRCQEGLALARELSHPTTLAHARFQIAMFHQFRRDLSATREQAEALQELATEHGLPTYLAVGSVLHGWALAEEGKAQEGAAQIRQELAGSAMKAFNLRGYFLALLAEAHGKGGKAQEGLDAVVEALQMAEVTGTRHHEPELHRLKGELQLAHASAEQADAEACFRQAIEVARQQSAKSLELRAVMSLSRLYHQQGKKEEARQVLAEIYGWFTEGFDTVDLREAKALLQAVS